MQTDTYSSSKINLYIEAFAVHWELLLQNDSSLLSFEQVKSIKFAIVKLTPRSGVRFFEGRIIFSSKINFHLFLID